jgi:hypothetical protein
MNVYDTAYYSSYIVVHTTLYIGYILSMCNGFSFSMQLLQNMYVWTVRTNCTYDGIKNLCPVYKIHTVTTVFVCVQYAYSYSTYVHTVSQWCKATALIINVIGLFCFWCLQKKNFQWRYKPVYHPVGILELQSQARIDSVDD